MQQLLIKNATQMLTMTDGAPCGIGLVRNGWLYAEDGVIRVVGSKDDIRSILDAPMENCTIIDARGKTVLPGFVDCHTHTLFGGDRVAEYSVRLTHGEDPETLNRMGVKNGLFASVEATRATPREDVKAQTRRRVREMLRHGTTTLEIKSGYGLSTQKEVELLEIIQELRRELPLDIASTFLGANGWPEDMSKEEYLKLLCEEMIPLVGEKRLAEYCDVWCETCRYTAEDAEKILRCGKQNGLLPRIHADGCSDAGAAQLAVDLRLSAADHLNYTPEALFPQMAKAGVVGVVAPALDFATRHNRPANARAMLDSGMTLALASSCSPACWVESMQFVIILACRLGGLSPDEALYATTAGGAKALRLTDRGVLAPGKRADIQIWDAATYEDVAYQYGRNLVETVICAGVPAVRESRLL